MDTSVPEAPAAGGAASDAVADLVSGHTHTHHPRQLPIDELHSLGASLHGSLGLRASKAARRAPGTGKSLPALAHADHHSPNMKLKLWSRPAASRSHPDVILRLAPYVARCSKVVTFPLPHSSPPSGPFSLFFLTNPVIIVILSTDTILTRL
jgi:hypothetical protein